MNLHYFLGTHYNLFVILPKCILDILTLLIIFLCVSGGLCTMFGFKSIDRSAKTCENREYSFGRKIQDAFFK